MQWIVPNKFNTNWERNLVIMDSYNWRVEYTVFSVVTVIVVRIWMENNNFVNDCEVKCENVWNGTTTTQSLSIWCSPKRGINQLGTFNDVQYLVLSRPDFFLLIWRWLIFFYSCSPCNPKYERYVNKMTMTFLWRFLIVSNKSCLTFWSIVKFVGSKLLFSSWIIADELKACHAGLLRRNSSSVSRIDLWETNDWT